MDELDKSSKGDYDGNFTTLKEQIEKIFEEMCPSCSCYRKKIIDKIMGAVDSTKGERCAISNLCPEWRWKKGNGNSNI